MKSFLFLILFFSACLFSFGQDVKLKAYVQSVLPGTVPRKVTDESGRPRQTPSGKNEQYYVYLLYSKKTKVVPVEMWLNGKPFSILPRNVEKTPVEIGDSNNPAGGKTVAIPQTKDKVVQLKPSTYTDGKSNYTTQQKAKANDVVVVYKINGKFRTVSLPHFVRLEPIANQ